MNRFEKSKKRLPGSENSFESRARKPVVESYGFRCPACGKDSVVESSVVSGKKPGGLSLSGMADVATGRKIGRRILKTLFKPLEKKLAREGMPMIWRDYYCANCGGQFGGDTMFLAWFNVYWRRQHREEQDKTINHHY